MTSSEASGPASGLRRWLAEGNNKYLALGGAGVVAFALYERVKGGSSSSSGSGSSASSSVPTVNNAGTGELASDTNELADLEDEVGRLGDQVSALSGSVGSSGKAKTPGDVPLASSKVESIPASTAGRLHAPIVDAIPAKGGDGMYYLGADGGIITTDGAPFYGSAEGKSKAKFVRLLATKDGGYSAIDAKGQEYHFAPKQQGAKASASSVIQ